MMVEGDRGFIRFFWRVSASHIASYFVFGLLAYWLFDYRNWFQSEALVQFMISTDTPQVAAGPALQVFRGLLFALVLWPIRSAFLGTERGWLHLWLLFVGLAILGTAGPSPGSLEGLIYTRLPFLYHVYGLPEVVLQTLVFSLMLTYWYKRPSPWWNRIMVPFVILIMVMGFLGVLAALGIIEVPQ